MTCRGVMRWVHRRTCGSIMALVLGGGASDVSGAEV